MNKLSRLFVRQLERIARREAQRNAHRNGLLTLKVVEINGHLLRRYSPAFETLFLSGDRDRDGSDPLGYREDMLATLMAGRAAEQIVVGKVSSGSAGSDDSDLARATKMALAMERSLDFGAIQPLLYRHDKDPTAVLDANPDLAARIHARLETALARAVEVLSENRAKLDALTKALFDAQALDGEAVKRLLKHGDRAPRS